MNKLRKTSDNYIGEVGTSDCDEYEYELSMDVSGKNIKNFEIRTSIDIGRTWAAYCCTESSNFKT